MRIGPSDIDLQRRMNELHAEALDAIRGREDERLDARLAAYREILREFPKVWARFGESFTPALASDPHHILGFGILDRAAEHNWEMVSEALAERRERVPAAITVHPYLIGSDGFDALSSALTGLSTRMAVDDFTTAHASTGVGAPALKQSAIQALFNLGRYQAEPALKRGRPPDRLEFARSAMADIFGKASDLARHCLEQSDEEALRDVYTAWGKLDDPNPAPPDVERPEVLAQPRCAYWLGVLAWALRLQEAGYHLPAGTREVLTSRLTNPKELVSALEQALLLDGHMVWHRWYMDKNWYPDQGRLLRQAFLLVYAMQVDERPAEFARIGADPAVAQALGDNPERFLPSIEVLEGFGVTQPMGRRSRILRVLESPRQQATADALTRVPRQGQRRRG